MKKHYTVPISLTSLHEKVELATILGSYSVSLDKPNEREVKTGCDIIRRVPGCELVLWDTLPNAADGLKLINKWLTEYQELHCLAIQPRLISTQHKPATVVRQQNETGWQLIGSTFTNSLACIIDSIPNWGLMQETYNRCCNMANNLGIKHVIPWISLGMGRKPNGVDEITPVVEWDYDTALDEWMGREINNHVYSDQYPRYPRWSRAPYIVLENVKYDKHLFSYLKGASH